MTTGTKSLLFGVHQFVWHPVTVLVAWWRLYGRPTWKELVCIIVHDWGYWGSPNMDDERGERHPETGAEIARVLFGGEYFRLVLLHSRHYARRFPAPPSKLCWADKLSLLYDPPWFYLARAILSGELSEYRHSAAGANFVPLSASHGEWMRVMREKFRLLAETKKADVVEYANTAYYARRK
jgi:hypothetical protein